MTYLLDTNVLSELRKYDRCNPLVSAWFAAQPANGLFTSVLVIGEIRKGIELRRRHAAAQAERFEAWLARVIEQFAGRIVPVDRIIAEEWGRMNALKPLPPINGYLAATARVHTMTLVTRDATLPPSLGVPVLNPFEPPSR